MSLRDYEETYFETEGDPSDSTRELVLVVLEQLSVCYDKLGYLNEAEPLIDRLTDIARDGGKLRTH